jgi:hypothetical protein
MSVSVQATDVSPAYLKEKFHSRQAFGLFGAKKASDEKIYVLTAYNNTGNYSFTNIFSKHTSVVKNDNHTKSFEFSYPFVTSVHETKDGFDELQIYNVESQQKFSSLTQDKQMKISVIIATEKYLCLVLKGGLLLNIKWQVAGICASSVDDITKCFVAAKSKAIKLEEAANLDQFDHKLSSLKRHRLILTDGLSVFVFDTKTGKLIAKRHVPNQFKLVIVETDGDYIAASNSEKLFFWHITNPDLEFEVPTEYAISSIYLHDNKCMAGSIRGLVDIYDMPKKIKSQPFHNVSSVGAHRKSIQDLIETRVNWLGMVGEYLFVLVQDKMNIWDISLDERFTPLKKKSFKGRKHKFLLSDDGQIFIGHVNLEKERAHDQIDVYHWKPSIKAYEKRAKRVKKSTKYKQMTESIIGREVLIKLLGEPGFVNSLFLNSGIGSRVDTSVVDAFLRVSHNEGKLLDFLHWAVDAEFESLETTKAQFMKLYSVLMPGEEIQSYDLLFNDNRITTQIILRFIVLLCAEYMQKLLSDVFVDILKYPKQLEISTMISNKKKRTQEEKLNAKNSKKLIKFATTLTSTLTKHKSAIPPMLLSVMQRIDTNMKKYFPDMPEETRYRKGMAVIMHEKFLCRMVAAPDAYNLTNEPITDAARYNLNRLSTMFECIALGKPVQEESLKAFVHECAGRVTHLYEGITKANANQYIHAQPLHGHIQHFTKSAQKKQVSKSLNPDHVMIDKDFFLIGGFIVFKSAQIIEHTKDKNAPFIPILKKFAQKAEQPETREMCRMCVGDAEDAAEFVPVDEIKSALERGTSMPSMSESESSPTSPLSSARERSDSELGVRPSTSSSSVLIQNAAFLTKNPASHERLVDWLRAEIPNHKFFLVIVFRGSWCGFCSRYMKSWNKYFSKIIERGGMMIALASEDQRVITKATKGWGLSYPVFGEPENTIADEYMLNITQRAGYVNGMAQPGILGFTSTGKCIYFWKSNPKASNGYGAFDRPKPRDVMKATMGKLFKNDSSTEEDDESTTDYTSSTSASESAM